VNGALNRVGSTARSVTGAANLTTNAGTWYLRRCVLELSTKREF
jgi:hypothetical protein